MLFIFQVEAIAQPLDPTNDSSDLSPTSTYSLVGLHIGFMGSTVTRGHTLPESLYAQVQMSARSWNNSPGIPHTALAAISSLYLSVTCWRHSMQPSPSSPCKVCIPADILRVEIASSVTCSATERPRSRVYACFCNVRVLYSVFYRALLVSHTFITNRAVIP